MPKHKNYEVVTVGLDGAEKKVANDTPKTFQGIGKRMDIIARKQRTAEFAEMSLAPTRKERHGDPVFRAKDVAPHHII